MIRLKRVYERAEPSDGIRVLVERLWPRGLSKEQAQIDLWIKELAPSTALRRWFAHDPAKWEEFHKRYWRELEKDLEGVQQIKELAKEGTVTFLYAAHDEEHNSAKVLHEFCRSRGL